MRVVYAAVVFAFVGFFSLAPATPAHAGVPTLGCTPPADDPEVAALARSLNYNLGQIYEYVYYNIEFVPTFGSRQGALGTYLNKRGNNIDQNVLFVSLLRQSCIAANYRFGTLNLQTNDVTNLLGVANDVQTLIDVLSRGGIPYCVQAVVGTCATSGSGPAAAVGISMITTEVTTSTGTSYLDPSLKSHQWSPAIDLATAMGYNRTSLLSSATAGSSTVPGVPAGIASVRNLNQTNLRNSLNTYAGALANHLQTNAPAASAVEIFGGRKITSTNYGANLASAAAGVLYTTLPATLETPFTIAVSNNSDGSSPTVSVNLYASQIAGRRLTLTYSSSKQPIIKLDGVTLTSGPATAAAKQFVVMDVELAMAIPGVLGTQISPVVPGSSNYYVLAVSAGSTGRSLLSRHQARVQDLVAAGSSPTSEEVVSAALAAVGTSWITQVGDTRLFAANITSMVYTDVVVRGVVGKTSLGVYVDFRSSVAVAKTAPSVPDANKARFMNTAIMLGSSLESTVVQQMQKNEAVSTVRLFKHFNAGSTGFLEASEANWSTVKPLLVNWQTGDLNSIEQSLDGAPDRRVILPQNGARTINNWTGTAWYLFGPDLVSATISSGLKGGYGTLPTFDAVSPYSQAASAQFAYPAVHLSDPVNMMSGSYRYDHEDLVVGAGTFPFSLPFKRSYESINYAAKTELGRGWHHNYAMSALIDSDTFEALGERNPLTAVSLATVVTVIADLMPSATEPVANSVVASLAADWLMDQLIDNAVTIRADGQTKKFIKIPTATGTGIYVPPPGDASELTVGAGNAVTVTDKSRTVLSFDADGKIASWKDANNNTVTFSYTGSGPTKRLASVSNAMGRTLAFGYNGSQQLTSASDGSRTVTYSYDGGGNLATYTDTAPTPKTTNFSYGQPGLLSQIKYPSFPTASFLTNEYDSFGRIKKQTDALGNVWHYLFADGVRSEEIDPQNGSKTLYHDGKGNLVATIDPTGIIDRMTYDGQGRKRTTNKTFGDQEQLTYDAKHNVLTRTHVPKPGSVDPTTGVAFETRVQSWTYDATFNRVQTATDARGHTTTFAYDAKGNLLTMTQPVVFNGSVNGSPTTTYTYNSRGQPLTVTDPDNRVTTFTYDPTYWHPLSKKEATGSLNLLTAYGYNAVGDVTSVTDPKGNTSTTAYDSMRRVTELTGPNPLTAVKTVQSYDADGRVTSVSKATGISGSPWTTVTTTYNAAGLPLTVTAADGKTVTTTYDALRRVSTRTSSSGRQELNEYDAASRIIKVTDQTSGPLDPSITVNLGPVVREQRAYVAGLLLSLTDAKGNTLEYRYDGFQRMANILHPGHSTSTPNFELYGYDKADNLRVMQRRSGATIWNTFDALNRRVLKQPTGQPNTEYVYQYSGLLRAAKYTGSTPHHQFLYDGAGRKYGDHSPYFGTQIATLDGNGNITSIASPSTAPSSTTSFTYDQLNRLTGVIDGPVATGNRIGGYAYNTLSQRSGIDYGPASAAIASTTMSWTPAGYLGTLAHTWNGSSLSMSYAYNHDGQRSGVTASDASFLPVGYTPSTSTYTTNNLNQYTAISGAPVTHDANGNLTSYNGLTLSYNTEGQLISASKPGVTVTYQYDPFGRRIGKSVNGTLTVWASFGDRELHEYTQPPSTALTWQRRFVYGPGLDEPLAAIASGGVRSYQLQDALGSTIGVLNATGVLSEKYGYNAFGRPLGAGTTTAAYLFTGRRFDSETGLHYYRARYYSTGMGRFLQPDPIGTGDGLNIYAYVKNDPLNKTDPMGLWTVWTGGAGTVASAPAGVSGGFGIALDTNAGLGAYTSAGWRSGFGADAGWEVGYFSGGFDSFSGWSVVGEAGIGPLSFSFISTKDAHGNRQWGVSIGLGVGGPAAASAGRSYTTVYEVFGPFSRGYNPYPGIDIPSSTSSARK